MILPVSKETAEPKRVQERLLAAQQKERLPATATMVPDPPGLGTLAGLPPQARVAEPREMQEKNIVAVMIMIRMPVTHRIETKRKCPWKLPAPHTRARLYRS